MAEKYIVRLTEEERQYLEDITRKGKTQAYRIRHANILLKANMEMTGLMAKLPRHLTCNQKKSNLPLGAFHPEKTKNHVKKPALLAPIGWGKTLNPLYTAIISRKTSLKNSYLTPEEHIPAFRKRSIPVKGAPDLIVADEGVVILPTAHIEGLKHVVPFLSPTQGSTPNVLKTESHALAIGLCQILWALSRIELVLCQLKSCNNFDVKGAEIAERKSIRIALIRMDLRSLSVDNLSGLSRSKLDQYFS